MSLVVLIVDDSRAMRRIERNVVAQLGGDIEILEAEDGVSAIYQMRERRFQIDLILLDWMMPRMDGLTLAKRLKNNVNLSWIPVLMVTSVSDERKIRDAWRTGVDGYLMKPFTKEMLLRAIVSLEPGRMTHELATDMEQTDEAAAPPSFLAELPHGIYTQFLDIADVMEVEDRVPLLFRGDSISHFFFVLDGSIEEHRPAVDQNGARVASYGPGECFAVTELMSGDALGSNFITSKPSRVARLQKADFEALLMNYPDVNIALSRYLALRARKVNGNNGDGDMLYGSLDVLDVPDLIQALNLRQRSGTIEFPDVGSYIEISAGQVVFVHCPKCSWEDGKTAFFNVVEQNPKNFRFLSRPISGRSNVDISTAKLLLEYMRWLDETGAMRQA